MGSFLHSVWHPTLLLFVGVVVLPVLLFKQRHAFQHIDRGYTYLLWGSLILAGGAFLDYLEELPWAEPYFTSLVDGDKFGVIVLPFVYLPGVVAMAAGMVSWFPAIRRVSYEIERRELVEDELQLLLDETQSLAVRAEEASRSKSEFLATMGHELRTPLNAIIGFADLMQDQIDQSPEKRAEYLAIVSDSGRHLLSIINDILDMSKLESGRIVASPEPFNVDDVLDEAINYLSHRAREGGLDFAVVGELGDLHSDRRIVKQILINILSNAVKFTPPGGRVEVRCSRPENGVTIEISDTGVGMTDEELVLAMKPFVQVENGLDRGHSGTGLGLPLVDRFCRLLDGSMMMRSAKGEGTLVTISLPDLADEDTAAKEAKLQLV